MDRLLTDEELGAIELDDPNLEAIPGCWWDMSVCKAQDAKTLKAVGEWLEDNAMSLSDKWGTTIRGFLVSQYAHPDQQNDWKNLIEALLRGEMP